MSSHNVPLDPREIAEIEDMIATHLTDSKLQQEWRTKLLKRAQKAANEGALNRQRYRQALEQARLEAHPDPESYAANRVIDLKLGDLHEKRVQALRKRIEATSRKRWDKHEAKAEKASRTANPTKRRLPQRDRQYLEIIGKAEDGGYLDDTSLVLSKLNKKIGTYRLPHWEKTTISLKVMAMSVVSAKAGAQTINLRLSSDVCRRALKTPRGPAAYMQDIIRKALTRTFGKGNVPEFWFVIEADSSERFHLHGAVETPNLPNAVSLIDQALRSAGGGWDDAKGQHHQHTASGLDDPFVWASYAVKTMTLTRSRLGDVKLFASTDSLRKQARARWEDLRASLPQSERHKP